MFIVFSMLAEIGGIISLNIFDKGVSRHLERHCLMLLRVYLFIFETFLSMGGRRYTREQGILCRNMSVKSNNQGDQQLVLIMVLW